MMVDKFVTVTIVGDSADESNPPIQRKGMIRINAILSMTDISHDRIKRGQRTRIITDEKCCRKTDGQLTVSARVVEIIEAIDELVARIDAASD